jgi:hypothetical protein
MQVGAEMIQGNSQKVFRSCPRGRKIMLIGRQDYTIRLQPAAPSLSSQRAVFSIGAGYLEEDAWW